MDIVELFVLASDINTDMHLLSQISTQISMRRREHGSLNPGKLPEETNSEVFLKSRLANANELSSGAVY